MAARLDGARALGIDPGLVATGYAVIEAGLPGPAVLDAGVLETAPSLPLGERLRLIHDGVAALVDKHAPAVLALEDLYTEYRFPRTALLMAHARGVACLAAGQRDVPVLPLTPAEVKRAITGNGGAAKEQIQRGVQRLLGLAELPRSSHVADALALAFTAVGRLRLGAERGDLGEGLRIDHIGGGEAPPPIPPPNGRLRRQSRRSNGE